MKTRTKRRQGQHKGKGGKPAAKFTVPAWIIKRAAKAGLGVVRENHDGVTWRFHWLANGRDAGRYWPAVHKILMPSGKSITVSFENVVPCVAKWLQ